MKTIYDLIAFLVFTRKLAFYGFLIELAKASNSNFLYFLSFILSPLSSLRYSSDKSKFDWAQSIKNLGPIYTKFGQVVSTRPDIFGEKLASSLRSLQDRINPFDSSLAIEILGKEINGKIEDVFLEFNDKPIAAASIAQVHKAILKTGETVAVKILRPGIEKEYQKDIKLLFTMASLAEKFITDAKNLKLRDGVKIFEQNMKFELDLKSEASRCSMLKDNLAEDHNVIIPAIYWDYCTSKVLVQEWIDGMSIYDVETLDKEGIDKKIIVQNLAITFFNQAFRDGFFHSDLHPGNILVTREGKIAFLDFGIMGLLSNRDRLAMAEILFSLVNRDYMRVAEIHQETEIIPYSANLTEFALAVRAVYEPIIGKPSNRISVGAMLDTLFRMTSDFGLQTQPQLINLQKSIIVLEGIGLILEPEVNMWGLAEPWIKKWARKNLGFDAKLLAFLKVKFMELKNKVDGF